MRKVVIAGANGFLGRVLARHWAKRGEEVVGLVRRPGESTDYRPVRWDGATIGEWASELEDADLLVNLAGRSVNCRYHPRNRAEILSSRVESTRILGQALAICRNPPALWVNSSTATIYRHAEDRPQDEEDGEIGSGFSVEVAEAWERAFFGARVPGTIRKVAIRTALVLGAEEGTVFAYLRKLARLGLGGPMGSGRQMVSWVHAADFCRALDWIRESDEIDGIVNLSAPGPVSNRELMRVIRRAVGRPWGLPAARWMLELGAVFLGTETELVLKSRWVLPGRLVRSGYRFRYPGIGAAVDHLVAPASTEAPAAAEKKRGDQMKSLSDCQDVLK